MEYPEINEPTEGWVITAQGDVNVYRAVIHSGPVRRGRRGGIAYKVEYGPQVWSLFGRGTSKISRPDIELMGCRQIAFSYDELLSLLQKAISNIIEEHETALFRLHRGISGFKERIAAYEMEILKSEDSISLAEAVEFPDIEDLL